VSFATHQLLRSFRRRFPRYLPAILALAVAAGAAAALGSLSSDIARKMTREFRNRGANAVARSRDNRPLSEGAVRALERGSGVERSLPVRVREGSAGPRRIVAVALDFGRARPFLAGWTLDGRVPASRDEALAGTRLAERLDLGPQKEIDVDLAGIRRHLRIVGSVSTGEGEDEELLVPWAALPGSGEADAVLLRLAGSGPQVANRAAALEIESDARVDPLLAVSTSEGRVILRLRGLLAALGVSIALLAALGTSTTLMASVVQRRREIALEKSLGADAGRFFARFLLEALALGVIGGVLGTAAGLAAADRMERSLFGFPLSPSLFWSTMPLLLAAALAAASSLPSVKRALAIEAITALREE
jgi:putative ABC transport system permease protein